MDMSNRIMNILKSNLPSMEVYSIDEAFFSIDITKNKEKFCHELAKKYFDGLGYL